MQCLRAHVFIDQIGRLENAGAVTPATQSAKKPPPRRLGRTSWLFDRLGLSPSDYPVERRGFIGIQIDGLGYYVLKSALTRRYLPFVRKLVKRRGWRLQRMRVGLPATTPASQLALFYGDNHDVPGFRWFEKDTRAVQITKSSAVCAEVEKRIRARGPAGVLRHGSSYCNMFSGDAERSTLTLSTLGKSDGAPFGWSHLLIFLLLWIGLFARIVALSLWETLLELYDHLRALQSGLPMRDEGVFPLVRVFTHVVFREIATQGCLLDIHRGVPFVYLNYSGYDEVAHHRGPTSLYAKLVLRDIDRQVKRIVRATERWSEREGARRYDVVLLSDHGQSTTIPWEHLHGQSLTQFLLERVAENRLRRIGAAHRGKQVGRALAFASWLREMELWLPKPLGPLVRRVGSWMGDRLPDEASEIDWSGASQLLVMPTGSLAHVYFTATHDALTIEEIQRRSGELLAAVVAHPSIAAVAARTEPGGVEIRSKRGSLRIAPSGERHLVGDHPLGEYLLGEALESEVVRLSRMPHAGDLVLMSSKHAGRVVNFQVEMGSHGGLHLDEQSSFLLTPPEVDFPVESLGSLRELHALFARYHEGEAVIVREAG